MIIVDADLVLVRAEYLSGETPWLTIQESRIFGWIEGKRTQRRLRQFWDEYILPRHPIRVVDAVADNARVRCFGRPYRVPNLAVFANAQVACG